MLGIIGAGNMARAIVSGLVKQSSEASKIIVSDRSQSQLDLFKKLKVSLTTDNNDVAQKAKTILFATKPQQLPDVCESLKTGVNDQLIMSIAAGTKTQFFNRYFGEKQPVVRAMPNLAAMVGQSITALYANHSVTVKQREYAEHVFSAIGQTVWLEKEEDMHAVTALSGSGPAYYFYMMEHMAQAGVDMGLSEQTARRLVEATCIGAGTVATQQQEESLETMIKNVCSKGGTTEAAMTFFQNKKTDAIIQGAAKAAQQRSIELSKAN